MLLYQLAHEPDTSGRADALYAPYVERQAREWNAVRRDSAVTNVMTPSERPLATSGFQMGTSVGNMIAPPLVAFCILWWGWQSAFLFTNFKENTGLADNTFEFKIPRGAHVVQAGSQTR